MLGDQGFHRVGDLAVGPLRGVLVDQRGTHAVVAHPGHQVTQRGTAQRSERVAGVPQIVEVQTRRTDRSHRLGPTDATVEIAALQRATLVTREHQTLLPRVRPVAGLFLTDTNPELAETLIDKAERGVRVRVLLGDPDSDVITQRGTEEGIGKGMAERVRIALNYLSPAFASPRVEIRLHETTLYNSIYRGDSSMLINTHVYGSGAPANPVIHLQRVAGGRMFDTYQRSFERVWDTATPRPEPAG